MFSSESTYGVKNGSETKGIAGRIDNVLGRYFQHFLFFLLRAQAHRCTYLSYVQSSIDRIAVADLAS